MKSPSGNKNSTCKKNKKMKNKSAVTCPINADKNLINSKMPISSKSAMRYINLQCSKCKCKKQVTFQKFESGVATALRTRETVNNHDDEYERNISGAESSPDSGAGADRSSDGGIVSTPEEEEVLFPARSNRLCSSKRTSTSSATTMSGASSSSGFSTGEKNSRISLLPPISTRYYLLC